MCSAWRVQTPAMLSVASARHKASCPLGQRVCTVRAFAHTAREPIPLRDVLGAYAGPEQFGRGCPVQDAAGSGVDPVRDVVEVVSGELAQAGTPGQVLAQQSVGVLV